MARDRSGLRREAERLYVEGGAGIKEIVGLLDVPTSTVNSWRWRNKWKKKRDEREKRLNDISTSLNKLRDSMLAHALKTLDHRDVMAALKVDKEIREQRPGREDDPAVFLRFLRLLTEILKERAPAAVAAIHDNYDLIIRGFKERFDS